MKLPTIKINFAPLLKLLSKQNRNKLKLFYYSLLTKYYERQRVSKQ